MILLFWGIKSFVQSHSNAAGQASLSQRQLGYIRGGAKSGAERETLSIEPTHPEKYFAQGTVGLSIEADQLPTHNLNISHTSLIALMRRLGPGVLRIGGGSVDYSWWTSEHEERPTWGISTITPAIIISLNKLMAATDWRVILGVDFGHFEPARAANEALFAEHILGSRLLGIEIGNEPDSYMGQSAKLRAPSYSVSNYLNDLATYSAAIHATTPKIRLYGPELSLLTWLQTIASNQSTLSAITLHFYPTTYSVASDKCRGTPAPSGLELLSPQVRERENTVVRALVDAGDKAHRETRISETNTTASCDVNGGPATSPVFASALWSLDWILRAASAGVSGLNFHGNFGLCPPYTFSPLCEPDSAAAASGQVTARPEYYGLLAAHELEGGRFVPVNITGPSASESFTAYATVHSHGVVTLAIDNFATEGVAAFILKIPGYKKAIGESLVSPSIAATSGVTFGHANTDIAGAIRPVGTALPRINGSFRLLMKPTSAIIVTLRR